MKQLLVCTLLLFASTIVFSQNKTLGVGTTTLNPNAALQVDAPNGNQGFLLPRLTTAQRTAIPLTIGDKGLVVFDVTTNNISLWNGTEWVTSVGGLSADADAAVLGVNTGNGSAIIGNIINAASTTAAVAGTTNGTGVGVYGENTGTGPSGFFRVTNASQNNVGLYTETNSNGANSSAFTARHTGLGTTATFRLDNTANTSNTLAAENRGLGRAGEFGINNALNGAAALFSSTNGTGSAGSFNKAGTGNNTALYSVNSATGSAGDFNVNNASSSSSVIYGSTNGTGNVLQVNHQGATGSIAAFQSASVNVARITKAGLGIFNAGTQVGGADVAEMFDVEGARQNYEPGDVLVISETTDRTVEKSTAPNSTKVAGVYATKPGVVLTEKGIDENLDALVPMGVVGVIPTKVCLENGAIKRGDLLVTSSIPGHAMKAVSVKGDGIFPSGIIIGKALENFEGKESGMIKVLVNVK